MDGRVMPWYAARFHEEWLSDEGPRERDSLVVVDAESPAEAQVLTGLTLEDFRPATDAELDEWDELCEEPLTRRDASSIIAMIQRQQRQLGKRRLRDREATVDEATGEQVPPRWDPSFPPERDHNRGKARFLAVLAGKIDSLGADDDE